MDRSKKVIIGTVAGITAVAIAAGGVFLWKRSGSGSSADGLAYVTAVSEINTAVSNTANMRFSGVVEPQEVKEIKVDLSKVISKVSVEDGDHVKAGDPLFTYDIESMELELSQGEVEIERMQNEISSSEQQIEQLESEKYNASADDQLTYTTQIQSLETEIAKTKYDIKTKEIELEKLKKTIKNATVKAEISGTVQSLKTVEQLQSDGSDVIMKIMSDGEFRVKCTISEQNMYMIYTDQAATIHSRIDDTVWSGTITEIGTEAESNQNNSFYMGMGDDDMTTASKYPFYITLDSSDGLMLGQHIVVTPDQGSTIEKSGIWLYSDYIVTDEDGESFVWAAGSGDKLEKRKVELGQSDEMMGDCEIVSGLEDDDMIAFPSDSYKEGMRTTTNEEEAAVGGEEANPIEGGNDMDFYEEGDIPLEDGNDVDFYEETPDGDDTPLEDGVDGALPADGGNVDSVKGGVADGT